VSFFIVMESRKRVLRPEHLYMLTSMANLASTFWNKRRRELAEEITVARKGKTSQSLQN
jgi:hypothetical protein